MALRGGPTEQCRSEGTPSLGEVPSGGARAFCLLLRFSKVSRRQGGTLSSRYRSNGYTPLPQSTALSEQHYLWELARDDDSPAPPLNPAQKNTPASRPGYFFKHLSLHQWLTAPLAPRPVCERTNCGKYSARSFSAAADLSVMEKNQMPTKAMAIENSAGYSYGKIAFS